MSKKDIKISKGKLTESAGSGLVASGETVIRDGHWGKLKKSKAEKDLIKVLKAEDKRAKKEKPTK